MHTEYKQTLIDAGFALTGMGWRRRVDERLHALVDGREAGREVWYAHVSRCGVHRDRLGNVTPSTVGSAYICCAPDPVTAMVYADVEGWKPTAFIEYFNCIRVGFPNG